MTTGPPPKMTVPEMRRLVKRVRRMEGVGKKRGGRVRTRRKNMRKEKMRMRPVRGEMGMRG